MLVWSVLCALWTAVSLVPARRPAWLAVVTFFIAWPVSELPFHVAVFDLAGVLVLVLAGAKLSLPGLALVALAVLGLAPHVASARRAAAVLEAAVGGKTPAPPRARLLGVLPFTPPGVEHLRDLVYGGSSRQRLDVWRPAGTRAGDARPTLLYVHGGGWIIGNKEYQGLCTVHELVAAGWVCYSTNYRLSPRATFPEHLDDVLAALAWVRAHAQGHGADPECIVLAGGSAGGHLASLASLCAEPPVQGCVPYYGVYDFTEESAPFPNRGFRFALQRWILKRRFADDPEAFRAASPIARVGRGAPPFFVVHGDRDNLVPVTQARAFVARLRAADVPVVYAELPGAGHAFEVFHSTRSFATISAVRRHLDALVAAHRSDHGTNPSLS
jgi:acetyl esterase/lipase